MNSRKVVGLFFKTLAIGGVVGLITSFFVKTEIYTNELNPFNFMEIIGLVIFFLGWGFVFSAISQTGFFAYLFINQFGLSLFRSFWPTVQVLLIAFVVFDLVYFPYTASEGVPLYLYMLMAGGILGYGWLIAKIKARQTNQRAFIPALFLMVVMTAVEWVPGLQAKGTDYAWLMITSLLACNTYQLLVLHKLTASTGNSKRQSDSSVKTNRKKPK